MAAPRRRECCLPDGKTLRFPPIDIKSVPGHAMIFKAKMHDDVLAMFNGSTTLRFDEKSLSSGVLKLKGDSYAFEALPAVSLPGNPMDLLFSIDDNSHIQLNGKISNTFNVERTKYNPNARRRRSPTTQKKRNVPSDSSNGTSNGNGSEAQAKRRRVGPTGTISAPHRKPGMRHTSALNGLGSSPYPSPHVSPGTEMNGTGSRPKSRSATPPVGGHGRRSLPPSGRTSPSSSSPGSSAGSRALNADREKHLRSGIIHMLALDPTPVQELKKRLLLQGEAPIGDRTFLNLVRKVSKHSKAGYVLKEEFWCEVTEDNQNYSEADKKRLRDNLGKRNRKTSGGGNGIGNGIGNGNGNTGAAMIVDEFASHKIISQALERFENRSKKTSNVIRNAKEEEEARSLFRAYHSVYVQVNKRMEDVRNKMKELHGRYSDATSVHEQSEVGLKIEKFFKAHAN